MSFYISRFKGLEKREFEVEVVTPLFLGGADPKKAELRAPSIKGALRFWWRAIHPNLSIIELKKQESRIFGDAGEESGKSKIQVKINNSLDYYQKNKENPVPHKQAKFSFPCFVAGEKFSLSIYGDKQIFDLFKFFLVVGGIGKRSRRGFGSLLINKIDGKEYSQPSSMEKIFALLQNISGNSFNFDNAQIKRIDKPIANYGYIKTIEVGKTSSNSMSILKKIGQSSHDNNSDYTGYAKGRERFASPVYVSVIKNSDGFKSIITTLNNSFKDPKKNHGKDTSIEFKQDILSGGVK